jgi:pimeloyl-ACP methyl ester carboxylesterase
MPEVTRDKHRIHYRTFGTERDGDDEGRPALLLFMGFATSAAGFRPAFIEAIGAHAPRLRVIGIDARGTGHSDKPDIPYSMVDMASDALAVMDALRIERAALLGASMGGMIAQELALLAPERIAALVLVGSSPGRAHLSESPPKPAFSSEEPDPLRAGWRLSFSEAFIERHPEVLDEVVAVMQGEPTPPQTYARHQEASKAFHALERLPRLTCPTLVIHGERDLQVPLQAAHLLADAIPNARLDVVAGAGHGAMNELPDEIAARISDFLAGAGFLQSSRPER